MGQGWGEEDKLLEGVTEDLWRKLLFIRHYDKRSRQVQAPPSHFSIPNTHSPTHLTLTQLVWGGEKWCASTGKVRDGTQAGDEGILCWHSQARIIIHTHRSKLNEQKTGGVGKRRIHPAAWGLLDFRYIGRNELRPEHTPSSFVVGVAWFCVKGYLVIYF